MHLEAENIKLIFFLAFILFWNKYKKVVDNFLIIYYVLLRQPHLWPDSLVPVDGSLRVPEQEAVSSVLRQGGLCLEARGPDSLGLAECRGIGPNRPHSQVAPLGGDGLTSVSGRRWKDQFIVN